MKIVKVSAVLSVALLATVLYAKESKVTLTAASYKEIYEINQKGEKAIKYVETGKVLPGDVVLYKNSINNNDIKTAKNLVLQNKIPQNTVYVGNSAACESPCEIVYSIDNGKSFLKPTDLKVKEGELLRAAMPSDYTDIKWVLSSGLPSMKATHVSFKAQLK